MRSMWLAAVITITIATFGASPAWAIAGGGFAPGGPMSGSVRPSCNGYNMDGTLNVSPGAGLPGCIDHSDRSVNRAYAVPDAWGR